MTTIELRDLHLVKKALAIAVLAIERRRGPLQSRYTRAAWIAVVGTPPETE
jgi:hypothetical protein